MITDTHTSARRFIEGFNTGPYLIHTIVTMYKPVQFCARLYQNYETKEPLYQNYPLIWGVMGVLHAAGTSKEFDGC